MTERGLRRYDPSTLRSISRLQNQHASIIPRISIPGDNYLHDLSSFNQGAVAPFTGTETIGHRSGQIHQGHLANPEPAEDWELNLFNIQEIGTSRFLHLLKKYPSITILLFGLFVLWGRGFNVDLTQDEKNMAIASIVAGATAITGIAITSQHHSNDKNNAKKQLTSRITIGVINALFSILVIVFSIITITKIHDKSNDSTSLLLKALTFNDRTTYAGILIGVSLLLGCFSLLSIFFGFQGLSKIHKDEKIIKNERIRRQAAVYATPTIGGIGAY